MPNFEMLLVICLLALLPVQRSWGSIIELSKFHDHPVNHVDVAFNRFPSSNDGAQPSLKEWKRQVGNGLPHIDGTHKFSDGYQYGSIYYAGGTSKVIVVLTFDLLGGVSYRSNLYRSTDYGSTYTNINGQVGSATLLQYFYSSGDVLIFVGSTESKMFYSTNQGASFTTVDLSSSIPLIDTTSVFYHPTRDGWMLMADNRNTLYLIEDYGKTVEKIYENLVYYQWSEAPWDADDRRVYFTTMDPNPNSDIVDDTYNLYFSDYPYSGSATEFDKNLGDHDGFLLVGRYIFAQRTDNGVIGLHVSDQRKPFKKAMIPVPEHNNYLVTHINDVQALVIVNHDGRFFNLYLSDESGVYYSLSLRDLVIDGNGIDLELIEGLNGTLIANQYIREDTSDPASSIRTLISLDNGGFWEGLLPPDEGLNGDSIDCEPPTCSLHLHMDTTNYSRLGVYSTESAPGIIVAHGTIGSVLSDNPDLYISRDGGVTWEQTLVGSWGVNLADHGGLMVAAKDYHQEESRVLKYSCDEGYSWSDFTFISTDITVYGLITEPGQHTTVMSIYGGLRGNSFQWTVVTVDFSSIFPRQCDDQDYYDWRPWDERTESECILGSSITIERRKPQICCLNGRDYDREFDYHICDCTSEDYECDYGFARPMSDYYAPCMKDSAIELPNPCADGNTKTYMASTGYRKIAGDVCTGGEEKYFQSFEAPCCGDNTLPPFFPPNQPASSQTVEEKGPLAAVGALFGVASLLALVFLVLFVLVTLKYRAAKRTYIRVATAEEPALFGSSPQEDTLASMAGEEEDDKPLIP